MSWSVKKVVILSMPVVGTYVHFFMFGGEFPGDAIIPRMFITHVLIIPKQHFPSIRELGSEHGPSDPQAT